MACSSGFNAAAWWSNTTCSGSEGRIWSGWQAEILVPTAKGQQQTLREQGKEVGSGRVRPSASGQKQTATAQRKFKLFVYLKIGAYSLCQMPFAVFPR